MDDTLMQFLKGVRNALFTEDFDTLSQFCVVPLVVYSAAGVVTIKDREELKSMADQYRQLLSAYPITHGDCRVVQRDQSVNHRFRVTARWNEYSEDNTLQTSSLVRYFLIETAPDTWLIEMLEYLEMAVSIEDAERIIH
ncbi:MAG: hypothetical protein ABJF50_05115 [Paracoccaceae bacterium]